MEKKKIFLPIRQRCTLQASDCFEIVGCDGLNSRTVYQINKKMERSDEDIVECIKSCWPEFTFNVADIRRPIGDKFRDILFLFLKTFNSGNSGNYQLPGVSLSLITF